MKTAIKSNNIYLDSICHPISGFILINGEKIEDILSNEDYLKDLEILKSYEILNYEDFFVFPGN